MKFLWILFFCCGALCQAGVALPIDRTGTFSNGTIIYQGSPQLEGKTILLKDKDRVRIQLTTFPAREGTLILWISPRNWHGLDGHFHILASLYYANNANKRKLQIYKYANANIHSEGLGLPLYDNADGAKPSDPGAVWINYPQNRIANSWKKNSWQMMAVTWRQQEDSVHLNYYVNDEFAGTANKKASFAETAELVLGPEWGEPACTAFKSLELHEVFMPLSQIVEFYETAMECMAKEVEP